MRPRGMATCLEGLRRVCVWLMQGKYLRGKKKRSKMEQRKHDVRQMSLAELSPRMQVG